MYSFYEQTYFGEDSLIAQTTSGTNTELNGLLGAGLGFIPNPLAMPNPKQQRDYLEQKIAQTVEAILWSLPLWDVDVSKILYAADYQNNEVTLYIAVPDTDLKWFVPIGLIPRKNPPPIPQYKFVPLEPNRLWTHNLADFDLSTVMDFVNTLHTHIDQQVDIRPLFDLGFISGGAGASKKCYLHPTLPFVLKFGGNPKDEINRARGNSRIARHYLFPLLWRPAFMIQPKVDRSKLAIERAMQYFRREFHNIHIDLHEGNVGIFNGRPVLIDF